MTRTRRGGLAAIAAVLLLAQTGCGTRLRWHIVREPSDAALAAALNEADDADALLDGVPDATVPLIPPPVHLRPCCAFGADLRTQLGALPIPGVAIGNVIGPEVVGPHKYDGGLLGLHPGQDPSAGKDWGERNGLVFTCRGGFLDIAHVRDYADWTIYFAAHVFNALHRGTTLTLADEGGQRRVIIHPIAGDRLDAVGARDLAIATAQWLAFELSVWHEIATWYGWSSFRAFPETASAFSPEDMYSNLIGTRIAAGVIETGGADTDSLYEATLNVWLRRTLERLDAQPAEVGRPAIFAVDGVWWDSNRRLPDKRLTLRRNFDTGETISPWLVTDAGISDSATELLDEHCGADVRPIVLLNPDSYRGVPLREVATLEIEVSAPLALRGFPFPRPDSRLVTQEDFPSIIAAIAIEDEAELEAGVAPPAADRAPPN